MYPTPDFMKGKKFDYYRSVSTHLKVVGKWMWRQSIISLVTVSPVATSFPNQDHELFHCNVIT
jgi:hypothetical protein